MLLYLFRDRSLLLTKDLDSDGNVGKVDRRGKVASGTCCGSAVYASKTLNAVVTGQQDISGGYPMEISKDDYQQAFVTKSLLPFSSEILSAQEPMVSLPYVTFKPIDNMIGKILDKAASKVGDGGKIALIGGLQINTPGSTSSDYFLPLRMDVRDANNQAVSDDKLLLEMYTGLYTPAGVRPQLGGDTEQPQQEQGAYYSMLHDAVDRVCVEPGSMGIPAANWRGAVEDGHAELVEHAHSVWEDIVMDADVHAVSKFLLICELPFTVLRKLTVPIPCDGYYVRALVALSIVVSPVWLAYYFWSGHDLNLLANGGWLYFAILLAILTAVAFAVLRFAPGGEGSMALAVSTPIALYGFVVAATWIDTIADSLVSVLDFVGIILRIPGPIVGLTILAWGNSMGDLSANVTMARKGLGNMAMTACFAGPVFNILVGHDEVRKRVFPQDPENVVSTLLLRPCEKDAGLFAFHYPTEDAPNILATRLFVLLACCGISPAPLAPNSLTPFTPLLALPMILVNPMPNF